MTDTTLYEDVSSVIEQAVRLAQRVQVLEAALVQRPTLGHFILLINVDIETCIHIGVFDTLEAAQDFAQFDLDYMEDHLEIEQWREHTMVAKWVQNYAGEPWGSAPPQSWIKK